MLTHKNLFSLEQYARNRPDFRAKVMAHKDRRRVALGDNANLYFEDALTMQYQVQEMLRLERIFEPEKIQEELDAYNPLIPDGSNWKATFMLEYCDEEERKVALGKLIGIDEAVWMRVGGLAKVTPIANEDLERDTAEKTAAVHFMRFELTPEMVAAVKAGATIHAGIDHANYRVTIQVPEAARASLASDLA
ncbi:MAG: DUF3501 family protein [Betaproteobacteria bacterium]|nr:DUF3501 family protein [Betaproteobacteria bacterium]